MAYLLVKKIKDGFSMLKISYTSKKDKIIAFFIMLFPIYVFCFFIIVRYLIINYFRGYVNYDIQEIFVVLILFSVIIFLSYWHNFNSFDNFLLDRKNNRIVLQRADKEYIYSLENIKLNAEVNNLAISGKYVNLYINGNKHKVKYTSMKLDFYYMFSYDRIANDYIKRLKKVLSIKDIK
jgi:hypothetical protein